MQGCFGWSRAEHESAWVSAESCAVVSLEPPPVPSATGNTRATLCVRVGVDGFLPSPTLRARDGPPICCTFADWIRTEPAVLWDKAGFVLSPAAYWQRTTLRTCVPVRTLPFAKMQLRGLDLITPPPRTCLRRRVCQSRGELFMTTGMATGRGRPGDKVAR
jgi:hypothetical protein